MHFKKIIGSPDVFKAEMKTELQCLIYKNVTGNKVGKS